MEEFKYKEEIISSRVGFLGGSDGNLLSSIAKLENIPESAKERLAICKGIYSKEDDFKTESMAIGDELENKIFDMLQSQDERWKSNERIESKKYKRNNVGLLVHIDFMLKDDDKKTVTFVECKATKKNIKETRYTYSNQLYIENVLGKEYTKSLGKGWRFCLKLCHYDNNDYDGVLDLDKLSLTNVRFCSGQFDIAKAMDLIDNYLENLTEYYRDDIDANYLPSDVQSQIETMSNYLVQIDDMNGKVNKFKEKMYVFMLKKGIKSIKNDLFSITLVNESETISFDSKKFESEHKVLYKKYLKKGKRKGYAAFKLKNNKNINK